MELAARGLKTLQIGGVGAGRMRGTQPDKGCGLATQARTRRIRLHKLVQPIDIPRKSVPDGGGWRSGDHGGDRLGLARRPRQSLCKSRLSMVWDKISAGCHFPSWNPATGGALQTTSASSLSCRHGAQKRDGIGLNHHRASGFCFRMVSAQTRPAFVARENRYTLFQRML
jgi:hypothetical protein